MCTLMQKDSLLNGVTIVLKNSKRLIKKYKVVYKENKNALDKDIKGHFYINSSLVYAKICASKNIPEIIKNSNLAIIEIYCSDFIEEEPIATKRIKRSWIHHPFLKDCDFWDFTGNSGY